jgi:hypothetical protein
MTDDLAARIAALPMELEKTKAWWLHDTGFLPDILAELVGVIEELVKERNRLAECGNCRWYDSDLEDCGDATMGGPGYLDDYRACDPCHFTPSRWEPSS